MYLEDNDVFILSGEINRLVFTAFAHLIEQSPRKQNVVLFLSTNGGDPGAGYRITRLLQQKYNRVRFVIPYMCKSAGTLMAIGANEIAMGDLSEFGPLDIQVRRNDEYSQNSSGLDLVEAMTFIKDQMKRSFTEVLVETRIGSRLTTKLCGDFATKISASIAEPLYSQIDPQRLGELQRAMNITRQYGSRLLENTKSISEDALNKLVTSYPEHAFVIDKAEAMTLFSSVKNMSPEESALCHLFEKIFMNPDVQIISKITLEDLKGFDSYDGIKHLFEICDVEKTNRLPDDQQQKNGVALESVSDK